VYPSLCIVSYHIRCANPDRHRAESQQRCTRESTRVRRKGADLARNSSSDIPFAGSLARVLRLDRDGRTEIGLSPSEPSEPSEPSARILRPIVTSLVDETDVSFARAISLSVIPSHARLPLEYPGIYGSGRETVVVPEMYLVSREKDGHHSSFPAFLALALTFFLRFVVSLSLSLALSLARSDR